ncbi:MAG TPA: IclR family transcriptional regulator [Terrimesophilobacter sp.]|nr:IclR family transcriptional regulator [Terrimesophilobacter sp.]
MAGGAADSDSALARASRILTAFDETHRRLTLTELSARSGLAASTTHRMLAELAKTGLVDRAADGRYTVGRRLWELGEISPISLELRETALPWLLTLYEATAENVHFAILDGFEALYVARLVGPNSVPTMSRMGGRLPLHTTGVGKVLLAWQGQDYLTAYFSRRLERPTTFSITSEPLLRTQLREIRERGYSVTHQEQTLGNTSIAVPVRAPDGRPPVEIASAGRPDAAPLAAVGVVTHTARADPARLVPVLSRAAAGLADDLAALMARHGISDFH